jgi:hypothetical protein
MNRPEEALQIACVAWLEATLPPPWKCWHTPNGGFRTKVEAAKFQKMGVRPGMPDLFVMGPHMIAEQQHIAGEPPITIAKTIPYLIAIEFKAPPKRLRSGGLSKASPRLSPAQRARQADLGACGVPYLVIDDIADMMQSLRALGVPLRGRVL